MFFFPYFKVKLPSPYATMRGGRFFVLGIDTHDSLALGDKCGLGMKQD